MKNIVLISEILEMNIAEERNGAAFYEALSESAKNAKLRTIAAAISQQEKEHEIKFARMRDEIEEETNNFMPDSEDYESYLGSIIGTKIFPNEDAAIGAAARLTDEQAIKYALRTEQSTLNLLNELKKHVESKYLDIISETIKEEENHIKQLNTIQIV